MEKINVAELLKDCPKGMELYSPIFGAVYFEGVKDTGTAILIEVATSCNYIYQFYPDGKYNTYYSDSECLLFPSKDQRDWSKFQRPFKDGDIISNDKYVAIFYKIGTPRGCKSPNVVYYHCFYSKQYHEFKGKLDFGIGLSTEFKYATEEEKEKLFQAIKDNGYKWNTETKTLEKLIEPKFKVGDKVKRKEVNYTYIVTIAEIDEEYYTYVNQNGEPASISIKNQDNWELVPNKFDITTLKPFDKVLVRDKNVDKWKSNFWGFYDIEYAMNYPYECCGNSYAQCIPYEGNEQLLGTTNDCDEYFKIWEN